MKELERSSTTWLALPFVLITITRKTNKSVLIKTAKKEAKKKKKTTEKTPSDFKGTED